MFDPTTLSACTCGTYINGKQITHTPIRLQNAFNDGMKAYWTCTGSPYLFCRQMDSAFDQGYAAANEERTKANLISQI